MQRDERLEAALVRGDPVPLHEQLRSQRRAAFAGVVLGMLGVCGVAVYAMVVPSPNWRAQDVVIGAGSGAVFAIAHGPDRLVPVANLPAARLVLAASGSAEAGAAVPVVVPDDALATAARTPMAVVPGAVGVRAEAAAPGIWAVCDRVAEDGRLLDTTVIGGVPPPPGPSPDSVLLAGPGSATWLVTGGTRHRVDIGDGRLRAAFRLTDQVPRAASAAVVSLVAEGNPLATPHVPGRGDAAPPGLPGRIGDVLVDRPVDGVPRYFVVLRDGLQEVPAVVADLLRGAAGSRAAQPVGAEVLGSARFVTELAVDGWPSGSPRLEEPRQAPVVCWTWSPEGPARVWTGAALPLPPDVTPVALAQADGGGERIDAVALGGGGGAVRATAPGRAPGVGPVWLVSGSGVGYRVADDATAAALGVSGATPAPEAALRLLPTGPTLDVAQAARVVEVLPSG